MTDAGLKELAASEAVADIDAGLKELAALKNLTTLGPQSGTDVTDAGLKELAALKNLSHPRSLWHKCDGRRLEGAGGPQEPHHSRSLLDRM